MGPQRLHLWPKPALFLPFQILVLIQWLEMILSSLVNNGGAVQRCKSSWREHTLPTATLLRSPHSL